MASNAYLGIDKKKKEFARIFHTHWIKWEEDDPNEYSICIQTNVICSDFDTRTHMPCMYTFRIKKAITA